MIGMQCPKKCLHGNRFFSNNVNFITGWYKDAWRLKELIIGPVMYSISNGKNSFISYNWRNCLCQE
jgi:hypothetical protein